MLRLTKGEHGQLIVTLNERAQATTTGYRFTFTHRTTKEVIVNDWTVEQDESPFPYRYDQFGMDVNSVFGEATPGMYTYEVHDLPDGVFLESGIMQLIDPNDPNPPAITNQQDNSVVVYTGYPDTPLMS